MDRKKANGASKLAGMSARKSAMKVRQRFASVYTEILINLPFFACSRLRYVLLFSPHLMLYRVELIVYTFGSFCCEG